MQVNSKCNLKCRHCFYSETDLDLKDLCFSDAKRYISRLKSEGLRHIGFTFKEPLLNRDIFRMIYYAEEIGLDVVLLTNGILLSEYCNEILNSGINSLGISLDGISPETNDQIRGKGSFEKVIEGLKRICKERDNNKYIPIILFLTINSQDECEINNIFKFIENNNFDKVVISDLDTKVGEARNNQKLEAKNKNYFEELCKHYSKLRNPKFVLEFAGISPFEIFYYNFLYNINLPLILPNCSALAGSFYLNVSGEISLCVYEKALNADFRQEFNIMTEKQDFLNSLENFKQNYKKRKEIQQFKTCSKCHMYNFCNPCLLDVANEGCLNKFCVKCNYYRDKIKKLIQDLVKVKYPIIIPHSDVYIRIDGNMIEIINLVSGAVPYRYQILDSEDIDLYEEIIEKGEISLFEIVSRYRRYEEIIQGLIYSNGFSLKI